MSKKKKRNKAGNQPTGPTQPIASEGGSLDKEAQAARRAQQKAEWVAQKKKDDRRPIPASTFAWIGGLAGIAVLTVAGVFLLVSGGSDSGGPAAPTATPDDPRVAGLPIAKTVDVEADDNGQAVNPRFSPTSVTGNAGEVIEIRMINVGAVAHNLRVAGIDKEYDTRDDFLTDPGSIKGGEEGSVLVKIDEPGTYPFRCDFHPVQQIGNLVLN